MKGEMYEAPAFAASKACAAEKQSVTLTFVSSARKVRHALSPSSVSYANVSINGTNGTVSVTAVANGYGTNTFTVTANDGQSTNNIYTQTFTLKVSAVNDAPIADAQSDRCCGRVWTKIEWFCRFFTVRPLPTHDAR